MFFSFNSITQNLAIYSKSGGPVLSTLHFYKFIEIALNLYELNRNFFEFHEKQAPYIFCLWNVWIWPKYYQQFGPFDFWPKLYWLVISILILKSPFADIFQGSLMCCFCQISSESLVKSRVDTSRPNAQHSLTKKIPFKKKVFKKNIV